MIDKLLYAVSRIIPPPEADKKHLARWRASVAASTMVLMFAVTVHIAWACGFLPGLPGFAQAQDVQGLKEEFTKQRARLLEQSLLDMRTRQCKAIVSGNPDAKRFAAERMAALNSEYEQLSGRRYQLPSCDEL